MQEEIKIHKAEPLRCPWCHEYTKPGIALIECHCGAKHHMTCVNEMGGGNTCGTCQDDLSSPSIKNPESIDDVIGSLDKTKRREERIEAIAEVCEQKDYTQLEEVLNSFTKEELKLLGEDYFESTRNYQFTRFLKLRKEFLKHRKQIRRAEYPPLNTYQMNTIGTIGGTTGTVLYLGILTGLMAHYGFETFSIPVKGISLLGGACIAYLICGGGSIFGTMKYKRRKNQKIKKAKTEEPEKSKNLQEKLAQEVEQLNRIGYVKRLTRKTQTYYHSSGYPEFYETIGTHRKIKQYLSAAKKLEQLHDLSKDKPDKVTRNYHKN